MALPSTEWPRSSDFEDGTPGETVTLENSIVGGIHWDDTNEYAPWEAIFVDQFGALSGDIAITSIPNSYENLHFPFGADAVTNAPESFFFWCQYYGTTVFDDSTGVHQIYTAPLGATRNTDYNWYPARTWVEAMPEGDNNLWWVEFEDAEWTTDGLATQYSFEIPDHLWVRIAVDVTTEGDIVYTFTDEEGTSHGTYTSRVPGMLANISPREYFAFHLITVTDGLGTGTGRLLLDNVNLDPDAGPEEPEVPDVRAHYMRSIRNDAGDLLRNCVVTLFEPGTETRVKAPIYVSQEGTSRWGSRWYALGGVIDFYVDFPMIVDVHIQPLDPGSGGVQIWRDQWIGNPNSTSGGGGIRSVNDQTGDVMLTAEILGAMIGQDVDRVVVVDREEYDLIEHLPTVLYLIRVPSVPPGGGAT